MVSCAIFVNFAIIAPNARWRRSKSMCTSATAWTTRHYKRLVKLISVFWRDLTAVAINSRKVTMEVSRTVGLKASGQVLMTSFTRTTTTQRLNFSAAANNSSAAANKNNVDDDRTWIRLRTRFGRCWPFNRVQLRRNAVSARLVGSLMITQATISRFSRTRVRLRQLSRSAFSNPSECSNFCHTAGS